MQLHDQAIYCLPDGTYTRAVHRADVDAERAWALQQLDTGALQYTIGTDGRLTGYAIWERIAGEQTYAAFPTDLTLDDLAPA
jgi:hypothetical protein